MILSATRLLRTLLFVPLLAWASSAEAQEFKIPADYYSRFSSVQVVADTYSGIGVRDLPLPFKTDVRLSIVKAPTYWDYGLSFKEGRGEIRFGVFYSALQFRASYIPPEGMVFLGLVHGGGGDFAGGYAWRLMENKVRVSAVGGLAFEGDRSAPYIQVAVTDGESFTSGPLQVAFDGTAVATYFPQSGELSQAYNGMVRGTYALTPNLSVYGHHYAQFVFGSAPLAKFDQWPVQLSQLSSTYRFDASGAPVEIGAVKVGVARNWLTDENSVGANVYFRIAGLPALIGVSVSRVFSHNGSQQWVYSFTSM